MNTIVESLVTVGLPFYNNEKTLSLAIKSVLKQTFPYWQLILIDDGSTDDSFKIAKEFTKQDARIQLIHDGLNRGLVYRLNQITNLSKTRYIARMDGDDAMDPQRLEKQICFLMENPDVDVVDTAVYTMDEKNNPVGKRNYNDIDCHPASVVLHALLLHASIVGKTAWFTANPYDEKYLRAEDYELWCRTYANSNFARIKEPLYICREGKVNVNNYAVGSNTVRKIIKKYGRSILPIWRIKVEMGKSRAKVMLYKFFSIMNSQDYLSRKRNISLDEVERLKVKNIINSIEKV